MGVDLLKKERFRQKNADAAADDRFAKITYCLLEIGGGAVKTE